MTVPSPAVFEAFRGKYSSSVVGLLACQVDSYLKTLTTKVVSCREIIAEPVEATKADNGGKNKKGDAKKESAQVEQSPFIAKYAVELADTILFPEGGGQPSDTGLLTILSTNKTIPVYYVKRDGLIALHETPEPIEAGTEVGVSVDWRRRFDHMQQHTGQHLLSALLDKRNVETLSWSMGKTVEKSNFSVESEASKDYPTEIPNFNYIEVERKLTQAEIDQVQAELNDTISDMLDISVEIPEGQSPQAIDGNDKGVIRHVRIGDLDLNPCCGTHLKSTSHIMSFSLYNNVQNIRGTNCRLFFMAGNRVSQYARAANDRIRKINATISSTTETIDDKIAEINGQLKTARVGEKYWLNEAAAKEAKTLTELVAKFTKAEDGAFSSSDGKFKYNGHVVYNSRGNIDYFRTVEKEIGNFAEIAKETKNPFVFVFAGGQVKEAGVIIISGTDNNAINDVAAKIKASIPDVKGGGKGRWQGKVVEWTNNGIKHVESLFD